MKKNNLKNERGVTITSVLIYIIALTAVVIIIGRISTYFYRNMDQVTTNTAAAAEYTKFNSYFTDEINIEGNEVEFWEPNLIIFSKSENQYTFQGNGVYRNKVKICKDVDACTFSYNEDTKKIDVYLKIYNREYNVTYTVAKEVVVSNGGSESGNNKWIQGEKDENGNIPITNGKITVEVGDIITNYNPIPDGEEARTFSSKTAQTGYTTDQTFSSEYGGTWKVIGVSDEGQILIAPTDVIKTTSNKYYYLQGQDGYANAVNELDKISAIFGHGYGAVGAEDVNKVTGYNPNNIGVYDPKQTGSGTKQASGKLNEYGNEITYYWKGDAWPHYTTTNGLEENITRGHSPAFNWFDSNTKTWKLSQQSTTATTSNMEKITTLKVSYYYYYPETLKDNYDGNATIGLSTGSKAYNALFISSEELSYWLSSPYIYAGIYEAGFGVQLVNYGYVYYAHTYNSYGSTSSCNSGVRPVVILKSDIQLKNSSTDEWEIVKN